MQHAEGVRRRADPFLHIFLYNINHQLSGCYTQSSCYNELLLRSSWDDSTRRAQGASDLTSDATPTGGAPGQSAPGLRMLDGAPLYVSAPHASRRGGVECVLFPGGSLRPIADTTVSTVRLRWRCRARAVGSSPHVQLLGHGGVGARHPRRDRRPTDAARERGARQQAVLLLERRTHVNPRL